MRAMPIEVDLEQTRRRIADIYARRERLKFDLDSGAVPARVGLPQLDVLDRELSDLDSHFKALWDAHPTRTSRVADATPSQMNQVRP